VEDENRKAILRNEQATSLLISVYSSAQKNDWWEQMEREE